MKATELEMYEVLLAAYHDKFDENGDNWDEVLEFAEELVSSGDTDVLADFIGRMVKLTNPIQSMLSDGYEQCLGKVRSSGNTVYMDAAISRPFKVGV